MWWEHAISGGFEAEWLRWMVQMSWQVAVLAAAIWILTRFLRRSSAWLRHSLWLLIFVRLVLPPDLAAPWSFGTLAHRLSPAPDAADSGEVVIGGFEIRRLAEETEAQPTPVAQSPSVAVPSTVPGKTPPYPAQPSAPVRRPLPISALVVLGWGVVAAGLLLMLAVQGTRYARRLRRDREPLPEALANSVRLQAKRLGIRRRFEVSLSPHVHTPSVFGVLRPVVLFPYDLMGTLLPQQRDDLIAHELAHIKRHDIEWSLVCSVLLCLYWFHPFVWLASLHLRREREMACDDYVLYTTRQEGREYASTIVRVAEAFREPAPVGAGFLGLLELSDNLLHRVRSATDVTRSRRPGRGSLAAVIAVAALLLPMAAWVPTSAAQENAEEAMEAEISQYYAKADPEVLSFVRNTATWGAPRGFWLAETAFDSLTGDAREAKVKETLNMLEGPQSLQAYKALAEAAALKDARFFSPLVRIAWFMKPGGQDNQSKWMAVHALARLGDKRAVPVLIPLVDHYNKDTRMWSRAALARLTGEYFGADKQAWANWANAAGPDTAVAPAVLDWGSQQSEDRMTAQLAQQEKQKEEAAKAQAIYDEAQQLYKGEKFAEALEKFQAAHDAFSQGSNGSNALMMVGICYDRIGKKEDALKTFETAVEKYPAVKNSSEATWYYLGSAYEIAGQKDKAVEAYRRCVQLCDRSGQRDAFPRGAALQHLRGLDSAAADELADGTDDAKPPTVVSVAPASGATDVDPTLSVITVTFDQDMDTAGYSWTGSGEHFPETTGKPNWKDARTCELPVKLKPGWLYRFGINAPSFKNFRSTEGVPVSPVVITFTTKGATPETVQSMEPPKIVSMDPAADAKDVSPALDKLTVTFDKPMAGGYSWVTVDNFFPETAGSAQWSEDHKTCTLPVKLKPNSQYHVVLNMQQYNSFQSAEGVPLESTDWQFSTAQ